MKQIIFTLALLALTGEVLAQPHCPPPIVQVLRGTQAVPSTGAAFAATVRVAVVPDPACADGGTYRFREAEVTLMRGRRPAWPTLLIHQGDADLRALARVAQPGDRIHVFVGYKNLFLVARDGTLRPYQRPVPAANEPKGIDAALVTDEAKGIGFDWQLTQKGVAY
jgi:hypothetical protein